MIGQVLDSKYRIVRELGRGGMGAVFEAEHAVTGRRLAVKVILPDKASRPGAHDRFIREARAMGAIESPHVVQVLDAGRDAQTGAAYMAMELLSGEDLEHVLLRTGALSPEVVLRIAFQALSGIAAAHAKGIVHRDLKPANLFLAKGQDGTRVVKVLDFGIAKLAAQIEEEGSKDLTKTGSLLGSPMYMSPEQAAGLKTIDHRTDIWSLGCVLHEALSASPPYMDIEHHNQLILAICHGSPEPVQKRAPGVPPAVASLVGKALAHDPAHRFSTAQEMKEAVAKLLDRNPILTEEMLVPAASGRQASQPAVPSATPTHGTPAGLAASGTRSPVRRTWLFVALAAVIVAALIVAAMDMGLRGLPVTAQPSPETTSHDEPPAVVPATLTTATIAVPDISNRPVVDEPIVHAVTSSSATAVSTGSASVPPVRPKPPVRPAGGKKEDDSFGGGQK